MQKMANAAVNTTRKTKREKLVKSSEIKIDDLITKEDLELINDVKDEENESTLDVEASGNDIPASEILAFLKKLNVQKYRPNVAKDHKEGINDNSVAKKEKESKSKQSKKETLNAKNSNPKLKSDGLTEKYQKNNKDVSSDPAIILHKQIYAVDKKRLKSALNFIKTVTSRTHLLLKPGQAWRVEEVYPMSDGHVDEKLTEASENLAKKLFEEEVRLYSIQREKFKNSETRWLKTVLGSGTLSDKTAALTLLIQESPVHNLASLEILLAMSSKKGKREALMAVDTLRDLFLTGLLPDNRKLKMFNQQPLLKLEELSNGNIESRDKFLIMWYFESQLKQKYSEFVKNLGTISFDTLQAMKEKAISTVYQLLAKKPEQENVLLPMLVNKLGDPVVKSKAIYMLTKLVDEHPRMKSVVVREVQQLLHRPNITQRAQYYAVCYLTQIRLSESETELASQLIGIYFYFFQEFLKKSEVDNKMMSALLTGVNRAYVFAKNNKEKIDQQIESVYKIIPSVNFHTGVQALMLLHQVTDAGTSSSDRYYMCLYRKLIDPALSSSSKQGIFLNLLFKSLKVDVVDKRIKAFLKRILQVYSNHPPQNICGVLILLSEVLKNKPGLVLTCYKGEGTWSFDDEEEHYVDYPAPDEEAESKETAIHSSLASLDVIASSNQTTNIADSQSVTKKSSWVHRVNYAGSGDNSQYDPYVRNPLYAHAETECTLELHQLAQHFHPTVRLYANMLLKGEVISYDGDPVKDFTLARFLDRFVYKNPKKVTEKPLSMTKYKKATPTGVRAVPINSAEYLEYGEQNVPEDEKFFYRYFKEKAMRKQDEVSDEDDDGSIADEEFDAFLDDFEKSVDKDYMDDVNLDFASDQQKKTKKEEESSESEDLDEDDDFDDDLEDEELAAEFRKEMDDEMDIEENGHFSLDEEDELHLMLHGKSNKKKRKVHENEEDDFSLDEPKKTKKKKKNDMSDLFASAEQFAHLLDEDNETQQGGSGDIWNKEKAAQKQLDWEMKREHSLHSKKGSSLKGKHKSFKIQKGKSLGVRKSMKNPKSLLKSKQKNSKKKKI